jgi:hypothetical protein
MILIIFFIVACFEGLEKFTHFEDLYLFIFEAEDCKKNLYTEHCDFFFWSRNIVIFNIYDNNVIYISMTGVKRSKQLL